MRSPYSKPAIAVAFVAAALAVCAAEPTSQSIADSGDRSSSGCAGPQPAQRYAANITIRGTVRTALVSVPARPSATAAPMPLVLVFHGAGGNGLAAEKETGFTSLGLRRGFIVAYPNSDGRYWRLNGQSDYEFVRALVDQLEDTQCVDPARAYATGVSNGASLVGRLGCLMSDRLAAVAPVAGDDSLAPGCVPERPVSVLEVHGSGDASVPYTTATAGGVWGFLSAWGRWDGCTSPLLWKRLNARVLYASRITCSDDSAIAHLKLKDEPHAWPSLTGTRRGVPYSVDFSAREAIWDFFATHTITP